MPSGGFAASFRTRKHGDEFSFLVQGDEGFFPAEANSNPPRLADFEARIIHLMYNVHHLEVPGVPELPKPDLALNTGDQRLYEWRGRQLSRLLVPRLEQ